MNSHPVTYCLDSNIVIDRLRDHPVVSRRMIDEVRNGNHVAICSVVYYEVMRGLRLANATRRMAQFTALYESLYHLFLDRYDLAVVNKAVDIYAQLHKGQTIEDSDIFIAAISMVNGCVLVTDNVRHFSRTPGLRFVNWRMSDSWRE